MLKSLNIKNLATIKEVDLVWDNGFSVLTGETGAGKSILIESIRLALGDKGSSDVIRTGASEASIEAVFSEKENYAQDEEDTLILVQRRITENGPGRSYLDGNLVPLKKLREVRDDLVDIYGQNDHAFLRNQENQMDYLDRYAGCLPQRDQVNRAAAAVRRLFRRKLDLQTSIQERARRLEFLVFQIQEIENAHLKAGEETDLRQERLILKNAEQIGLWVEDALDLTYSQERSLAPSLAKLQSVMKKIGEYDDECQAAGESIEQFAITVKELVNHLIQLQEKQGITPEKLEQIEARLSLIENLKRKYGGTVEDVLAYLDTCKQEHTDLSQSEELMQQVAEELEKNTQDYQALCTVLSRKRKQAAGGLEKKIEEEIGQLGMKKARFKIAMRSRTWDPERLNLLPDNGAEELEYLLSPNPGEDLKPLRKIASGGELSRFMLALKSVGKQTEEAKTLIFDEIDAGIGGRTAEFVARKLRSLAQRNQVICITHLPQIASHATHHFRIEKTVEKDRTYTGVTKLTEDQRISEIARLLAGSKITPSTLKTAKEMLQVSPDSEP